MKVSFTIGEREMLEGLDRLSPREFMIAWTTAVRQFVQRRARERLGGSFGDRIARTNILTDTQNPARHQIYLGGPEADAAAHAHLGGVVRPKNVKYLAVPVDRSVKGIFPRDYGGPLQVVRSREGNRAYLGISMKRKFKPLWILLHQVTHKPRPWWPDETAVQAETDRFFFDNF